MTFHPVLSTVYKKASEQGYIATRLKSSLQKYDCHHGLVERYGVSICTMKTDLLKCHSFLWTWHLMGTSAGVSRKAEVAYPTGAPGSCSRSLSGVRNAHLLLLLCIYYFGYFMFFVVCVYFPCLVFVSELHSFGSLDYSFVFLNLLIRRQFAVSAKVSFFLYRFQ